MNGGPLVRAGSCPTQAGLLDLSNRNITVVPVTAFKGMPSLVKLSLRVNQLSTLPSGVFVDLSSLRSLVLAFCVFHIISFSLGGNMGYLCCTNL